MKYFCDLQDSKAYGISIGEKRGKLRNSLELAQNKINKYDTQELSDLFDLPVNIVQALKDGHSVEAIVKNYNKFK